VPHTLGLDSLWILEGASREIGEGEDCWIHAMTQVTFSTI
jgi:hypothetical protein